MNRINNTDGCAARRVRLTNRLAKKEGQWLLPGGGGVQRKIKRRVKPLASWVATCALLLSPCVPVHGGLRKGDVDFSNYNVPLFEQIVNRIKAKVATRLGEGENRQDRYFIIPFAYQNKWNNPGLSHSFISKRNKCPISVGRNFRLDETLKLAVKVKNAVGMWGPYEIKKEAFDLAVKRKHLLDGGTIRYRADDRLDRKDRVAINCFHAMAGLEELYPNGGFLGTGFKMWGINGTARVLIEYTKKVRNQGLLLEPVDIKKDLYGFVYAPERNSRRLYNPFPDASAYHQ
jgi:hypothetical protein